jgi:hypothetical protein
MLPLATAYASAAAPAHVPTQPCLYCTRRKFACFAIGNAGFHNPTLYDALRPAVGPLVKLLSDDEEKTRANAAGALGNLVRNSGQLCPEIIKVLSFMLCGCGEGGRCGGVNTRFEGNMHKSGWGVAPPVKLLLDERKRKLVPMQLVPWVTLCTTAGSSVRKSSRYSPSCCAGV